MEQIIGQSRLVCPFLSKASSATLRTLSTTAAPSHRALSQHGHKAGSELQFIARQCPVMNKAMMARVNATAHRKPLGGASARSPSPGHFAARYLHTPAKNKRSLYSSSQSPAMINPQGFNELEKGE